MEMFIAIFLTFVTLLAHPRLHPQDVLIPTPIPASIFYQSPAPKPLNPTPTDPWGVAVKIADHSYRIHITNDSQMGTPEEILQALNQYRISHGVQPLVSDTRLCTYANARADYFKQIKDIDAHKGFIDFLDNQNGFMVLGYQDVGENSSYGYVMSGVHLIEFVYRSSSDHDKNQLNSKWDHACVGVSGSATDLIFATSPL